MAKRRVYSVYYRLKQLLKRFIPARIFNSLVNYFHWGESLVANIIYGFPARRLHVVGVTGTNGKTTASVLLASILEAAGYRVGLLSTALFKVGTESWDNELNMTVTDQFFVMKLLRRMRKAKVDWVVLEVTSHALTQHRLMGIPFQVAVMTNLTQDHLDYHRTMRRYAAAKARLLKKAKEAIVLNADDDWYDYFAKKGHAPKVTYGAKKDADVRVVKAALTNRGSRFKVRFGDTEADLRLVLPGKFNVYNGLAAAAAAFRLGITPEKIQTGLLAVSAVPGRMEMIDEGQNFTVVVDYAHTPDALEKVLETLKPVTKGRLILVFGATGDRDRSKRPDMGQVASLCSDILIVTDDDPHTEDPAEIRQQILSGVEKHSKAKVIELGDRRSAIKKAFTLAKGGDTVILAGMGHQKYQVVGTERVSWDDRAVARSLLKKPAAGGTREADSDES